MEGGGESSKGDSDAFFESYLLDDLFVVAVVAVPLFGRLLALEEFEVNLVGVAERRLLLFVLLLKMEETAATVPFVLLGLGSNREFAFL